MSATGEISDRLAALGIVLPQPTKPVANYIAAIRFGAILTVSGQLPLVDGKLLFSGLLGSEVTVEDGVVAARACMINVLAVVSAAAGDLNRVAQVVRLGGFIASGASFTRHAEVMNGASDLAVAVFGERGRHARSTIGVASLPLGAPVEIEGSFALAE